MAPADLGADLDRLLTAVLGIIFVAALASVVFVSATSSGTADPYTEFYLLGEEGNASDYPLALQTGETGTVTVGIENHEGADRTYTLVARFDDDVVTRSAIAVPAGERHRENVTVTPTTSGNFTLWFGLYRGENPDLDAPPDLRTRLQVYVTEATTR